MREDVLAKRYYKKDAWGAPIENWDGLCERVAKALAINADEKAEFLEVLRSCLFLPNTPALINAGREDFSMSACFVLPVEDSMAGIFDAVKQAALVHKMGGGTGFSFSRLRPEGSQVKTTQGIASGPCSFIRVFDTATEVTVQGGTRRGANMGVLRVDHPDVEKFISLKEKDKTLSNFNLSVAITDEFMESVEADGDFHLRFNNTIYKTVKARELWQSIIDHAWANGEPGLLFIDTVNHDNPTPHIGEFEATNPCGEQPLLPYEACVLGSVNLAKMVKGGLVDYDLLRKTVRAGVVMLDNIIDKQAYPLPEVEAMHKSNRKIGLGVMGWADILIKMGISYNSQRALDLAEEVMSFITKAAVNTSMELAVIHGPFPNWEGSTWSKDGIMLRNASLTTIAPTGSISIIAGCSSGIEPVFAWETIQKRPVGEHRVTYPLYAERMEAHPGEALPSWLVTASEIPPEWHVKMQAAFQRQTHNAISKTVNLPATASKEDVEEVFCIAHELGCKGVTVYRDRSRSGQVISSTDAAPEAEVTTAPVDVQELELQDVEEAKRIRVKTAEGNVYVVITHRNGKAVEVFINSPGESKHAEVYESLARIISTALRHKVPLSSLLGQLERANQKYGSVVSPVYAVMRAFRLLGMNGNGNKCPDCGAGLMSQEGCLKCPACGYSKC
jgi:ribonucleoside-diphosphate reductase alpha chain